MSTLTYTYEINHAEVTIDEAGRWAAMLARDSEGTNIYVTPPLTGVLHYKDQKFYLSVTGTSKNLPHAQFPTPGSVNTNGQPPTNFDAHNLKEITKNNKQKLLAALKKWINYRLYLETSSGYIQLPVLKRYTIGTPVTLNKTKPQVLAEYNISNPVPLTKTDVLVLAGYTISGPIKLHQTQGCPARAPGSAAAPGPSILTNYHISPPIQLHVGVLGKYTISGTIYLKKTTGNTLDNYNISGPISLSKSKKCSHLILYQYTISTPIQLTTTEGTESYTWDYKTNKIPGHTGPLKNIITNENTYNPPNSQIVLHVNHSQLCIKNKKLPLQPITSFVFDGSKLNGPFTVKNTFNIKTGGAEDNVMLEVGMDAINKTFTIQVSHGVNSGEEPGLSSIPLPGLLSKYTISSSIKLREAPISHGDYTPHHVKIVPDEAANMHSALDKLKNKCKNYDSNLINLINKSGDNYIGILKNMIKKDINCCDDVDLSKFVLKTSVPPCSNVIPDKYKKYGEKYNPNSTKDNDGDKDGDEPSLYESRINDKFSIGYISLASLIVIIIMMKLL